MKSKRSKSDLEEQINRGVKQLKSPNNLGFSEQDDSSITNFQKKAQVSHKNHLDSISHNHTQSGITASVGIKDYSNFKLVDEHRNPNHQSKPSEFRIDGKYPRNKSTLAFDKKSTENWEKELENYDEHWNDIDLRDSMRLNMCELTGSHFRPVILEEELNRQEQTKKQGRSSNSKKASIPIQEEPAFRRLLARRKTSATSNSNNTFYAVYEKEIAHSKALEKAYPELARKYVLPENYGYNNGVIRLLALSNQKQINRGKTVDPNEHYFGNVPSQLSASKARIAKPQVNLPAFPVRNNDWRISKRELVRSRRTSAVNKKDVSEPEEVGELARTLREAAFKSPNQTDRQFYGRLHRLSRSLVGKFHSGKKCPPFELTDNFPLFEHLV